ncbi:MAG: HD-GYP domain-containing protein [Nitrospirota bacterium]|nr:HD-GYP domain-containing protein [Nitrospirota bacterium]
MPEEQVDARGEARQSFHAKQQLIASAKLTFQHLAAVIKNVTLYPVEHPSLLGAAEQLLVKIRELQLTRKDVSFYIVGGELFFDAHSIPVDQGLSLLMEQIKSHDVGGVIFKTGVTRESIVNFAVLMNKDAQLFSVEGGINAVLAQHAITHIELHRVLLVDKKFGNVVREGKKRAGQVFMDAIDTVQDIVQSVHLDKAFNMKKMSTVVHSMVDAILEDRDALVGLTSIKMYDEYTFAHSVNVAVLSIAQGTFLSFDKPQIAALGIAGMLHDIGKVSIPLEIINKPDKLTDSEWELMKRHPVEGALLLSEVQAMTKLAMVVAFEHHQHGDVRGYPKYDDVVQQHPFSQIVAIADAYDAITAARVYYKVTTPPDKAIRILLSKSGSAFNSVLVKAFVNMIGIFPVGTLLKLDTGEIGLVMHQTRDLTRPRVLLLEKFDGSEKTSGTEVSLLEMSGRKYIRTVVGTIDPSAGRINVKQYLE